MAKLKDVERLPLAELRRIGAKRPKTLYEMQALSAWARRATRGEEALDDALAATVAALTEDELLFGAPPGMLAAAVFHEAAPPVHDAFWSAARARLDANSLDRLERAFGLRRGSPTPLAPEVVTDPDLLTLWVYGAFDGGAIARAVAALGLPVQIDEALGDAERGEIALVTQRLLSRSEVSAIVRAAASASGREVACTLSAAEGELGPDQVLYAQPGAEPILGRVDLGIGPPAIARDVEP